jgi:hypothetical protein
LKRRKRAPSAPNRAAHFRNGGSVLGGSVFFADLKQTGDLSEQYTTDGFHKELEGRNGGGDRWITDGDLYVGVIDATLK